LADNTSLTLPRMSKDASDSPLVFTRGRDIHAAGIVLLQMLMGLDVIDRYPNVHEALRNCENYDMYFVSLTY
jgi:eukaryotic translation initiation factor 2-alpha kinase 4